MAVVGGTNSVSQIVTPAVINTKVTNDSQTLGKDAFLKLLLAEMKYQDPLSPLDNKDSIAQLAQFTSLEKSDNLSKSFDTFVTSQKSNSLINSFAVVGKMVDANITKEETVSETVNGIVKQKKVSYTDKISGIISSVDNVDGELKANLVSSTDGKAYTTSLSSISKIVNPDSSRINSIMNGAVLIGKTVEGTVTTNQPKSTMVDGKQVMTTESVERSVTGKVMSVSIKDGVLVAKIKTDTLDEYTINVNKLNTVQG